MLTLPELIKTCAKYNISSNNYGPSIYKNNSKIGLCLDVKDQVFGYLTRAFTFQNKEECEDFLNKYNWYQNNKDKYNIKLTLNSYETPEPTISYIYNEKKLLFKDMLNIKDYINNEIEKEKNRNEQNIYKANINALETYLSNLKIYKLETKKRKNDLKTEENYLKNELLKELTIYYGGTKEPTKKSVYLEPIKEINTKNSIANLSNLENHLKNLINIIKEEELDEQHLINLYSNNIYEYNISILKKQIDFVKNKITAEKNFNLKGSKLHNIDAELKSFLKTENNPLPIETFLQTEKNRIKAKYNQINNLKDAYFLISGNTLETKENYVNIEKPSLIDLYLNEPFNIKNALILYNSFYKDICNYIFDNNYPNIEEIITNCNIETNYNKFQRIVYNENNNHYLVNYFNSIDFNNLTTYTASLINLCKTIEPIKMNISMPLKAFALNLEHNFKAYSLDPTYNKEEAYIIELPINTSVIFIPEKLIIDEDTEEISKINSSNIYLKNSIIKTNNEIKINNYEKVIEKNKKYNIMITKDLNLKNTLIYKVGYIEEVLM